MLILPGLASDLYGILAGLLAASMWAAYIVINTVAGRRVPGLQAPAVGSLVSATLSLPVLLWLAADGRLGGAPLLMAVAAGVLSSAIPYAADLTALRHVSARFFGVFMSVHPVLAAFAGLLLLGQVLAVHEWVGIAIIVAANALATLATRTP